MELTITDKPAVADEKYIIDSLWEHNSNFNAVNLHPLLVTIKRHSGEIIGGLISRTWWEALEIQYLWVHERFRSKGLGAQLMKAAEAEAIQRGCHMAYVDTFSFQAQGFYHKLGYQEYGHLSGYAQKHTRHYLAKKLTD